MIKLNKMAQFEERLNDLFSIMDQNLKLDYSKISRSRSGTKTFGKATAVNYDLVDLYDLIDKLPDEYYTKVNALKSALDDLIVYQKTDIWATNGLSIYFPYENKTRINDIIYLYKKFNFASDYTEFIDNFTATLTGKRIFTGNVDDATRFSGAFYDAKISVNGANGIEGGGAIGFNASRSNTIYSKSTTVQPSAFCTQYLIKY